MVGFPFGMASVGIKFSALEKICETKQTEDKKPKPPGAKEKREGKPPSRPHKEEEHPSAIPRHVQSVRD